MEGFGKELILDLHNCDPNLFTRGAIKKFFLALCDVINMEACDVHFWDYTDDPESYDEAPEHLKGTSAIQFIQTSNITIHTLDELKAVYLNIFSCKDFSNKDAEYFCKVYFKGEVVKSTVIERK